VTAVNVNDQSPARNQYRTFSGYQMENRRLLLRGGQYDGRIWIGVIAVGQRIFCGDGAWSTSGVYVVSDRVETDPESGNEVNIAVPAFASS
jgi:hypothetical protein